MPYLNRFLSADTIVPDREDPQSFNRYSYVRNNPLKYVDSDGHCWGAASFIRGWNIDTPWGTIGGGTNCANIDTALQLVQNPDVPVEDRILPATVVGGFGVASFYGAVGTVGLACSAAAPCAQVVESALGIGTYACQDGNCGNEATLLGQAIQSGYNAIQNRIGQAYRSFNAFKNAHGVAGEGQAWHHIVNQNARNIARFGAERIHNTNNLIKLPDRAGEIHRQLTGYYNSLDPMTTGSTTLRVREWLELQTFEFQWQFGIDTIIRFGGQQYIIDQLGNGVP